MFTSVEVLKEDDIVVFWEYMRGSQSEMDTIALLRIEALGPECCGRTTWKSQSDLRYLPINGR
jgi:hypothetical protein